MLLVFCVVLLLGFASAFRPGSLIRRSPSFLGSSVAERTETRDGGAAQEQAETPLSPLTEWGSNIDGILELQAKSRDEIGKALFPKVLDKEDIAGIGEGIDGELQW